MIKIMLKKTWESHLKAADLFREDYNRMVGLHAEAVEDYEKVKKKNIKCSEQVVRQKDQIALAEKAIVKLNSDLGKMVEANAELDKKVKLLEKINDDCQKKIVTLTQKLEEETKADANGSVARAKDGKFVSKKVNK